MSRRQPKPRYAPGSRAGAGGRPRIDPAGSTVRVTVSLGPATLAALDAIREREGLSRSAAVRWAIERARERGS